MATPGGLDREVLLHYAEMIPSVTAKLVSVDFLHDDRSSIVDAPPTMVIGDRMARVVALYDNERGLRMPLLDLVEYVTGSRWASSLASCGRAGRPPCGGSPLIRQDSGQPARYGSGGRGACGPAPLGPDTWAPTGALTMSDGLHSGPVGRVTSTVSRRCGACPARRARQ